MDFTTIDDTAAFTAAAALDASTPRMLHIAGVRISARDLVTVASQVTGQKLRLSRPGGLATLGSIIKVTCAVYPNPRALYPPWQGMQYMPNLFSGLADIERLDNDRYPGTRWTTARVLLARAGCCDGESSSRVGARCCAFGRTVGAGERNTGRAVQDGVAKWQAGRGGRRNHGH